MGGFSETQQEDYEGVAKHYRYVDNGVEAVKIVKNGKIVWNR